MLVGDKNFEDTTRREYFTIHDMNISADYEYHNYQYSRPLQITLFELGRKSCSSNIYLLISQSFDENRRYLPLKKNSSSNREFRPGTGNFFR